MIRSISCGLGLAVLLGAAASRGTTLPRAAAEAPSFSLVAHASNPVSQLSPGDVRRLYTGEMKQWPNGTIAVLGLGAASLPETGHLAKLLDMSATELVARVQQQVFRGEMRRTVPLRSSQDCLNFARAVAGAVCVAEAAALASAHGVHAVSVGR